MHKGTRETIPSLVSNLVAFQNTSGTLRAYRHPSREAIRTMILQGTLEDAEISRLRIDNDTAGIQYVILSYHTPIAWVTDTGWTHKVRQELSQTSRRHMELLDALAEGFNKEHRITPK